jgi:hypothetical protein
MFLEGPEASARDAIHIIFANEKVDPDYTLAAPDVTESESSGDMQVISLPVLVRMKLTSFRDKDRLHLRDLLEVGLVNPTWCEQLPPDLGARLRIILDSPEG